jgi:hypothetical protein
MGLAFTPPGPDFTIKNFFPLLQVATSGCKVAKAGSGLGEMLTLSTVRQS